MNKLIEIAKDLSTVVYGISVYVLVYGFFICIIYKISVFILLIIF